MSLSWEIPEKSDKGKEKPAIVLKNGKKEI